MIGVLHTARINAIEVIVSSDKLIKMVNFKLGIILLLTTHYIYYSLLTMNSIVLILAVCRTPVIYELS